MSPSLKPLLCPASDSANPFARPFSCLSLLSVLPAFSLTLIYLLVAAGPWRLIPSSIRDSKVTRRVKEWERWFRPFLALEEAEALLEEDGDAEKKGVGMEENANANAYANANANGSNATEETPLLLSYKKTNSSEDAERKPPLTFTLTYTVVPLLESLTWLAIATYRLALLASSPPSSQTPLILPLPSPLPPLILTLTYLPALLIFVSSPPRPTPPYRLLALYAFLFLGSAIVLGQDVYAYEVDGVRLDKLAIAAQAANLLVLGWVLGVGVCRPMAVPARSIDRSKIGLSVSPEPYTSLLNWLTFAWVTPLVERGIYRKLDEGDVYELSATNKCKAVFGKWNMIGEGEGDGDGDGDGKRTGMSLLRKLWEANSMDLILDFALTFVSVVFNYAGPFFLKRILDAISKPTPERRAQAYIFAALAFLSTVMKAEADVQHLWFGRRAATRMKSELMAAIYDKALKRKDLAGVVNQKDAKDAKEGEGSGANGGKSADKKEKDKDAKAKAKADDPKAGADIGKIVNLMSGDAGRISNLTSGMYFLYGAPFEITIAATFLYQLLGISAFAGFLVLLLVWPLNSFITRRAIRIQKGALAARDKRMGVLNELILAIKFIKFFAWEPRWIDRVLDARKHELKWLVRSRLNSVMLYALWATAPVMVSIVSFTVFVWRGGEITVGVAFTAIALFGMIRAPLNIMPTWLVQVLQTRVSLQRIETFLNEEEVDEQVSTLKRSATRHHHHLGDAETHEFGFRNASFTWNAVREEDNNVAALKTSEDGKKADTNHARETTEDSLVTVDIEAASSSTSLVAESTTAADRKFELRDLNIVFPHGELTVVTGPTASGKTALLLALLGEMTLLQTYPPGELLMSKDPHRKTSLSSNLFHTISYAAQTPWLQHQSIKENILFGSPYEEERYKEVVECCALGPDLQILEDGDETEIGVRGVSLSGGQKARVALARAVYARTQFVLLDDPLSAVDSHTARFLYERLFLGPLLRNRTVILVTHHVELVLPGSYYIVRMLDGRIDVHGTVKELRARGVLEDIAKEGTLLANEKEEEAVAEGGNDSELAKDPSAEVEAEADTVEKKKPRKLVKEEEREAGGVKWAIYKTYLKASSYITWTILFCIVSINQLLGFTEKWWIMKWGDAYSNSTQPQLWTHFYTMSTSVDQASLMSEPVHSLQFTNHAIVSDMLFPGNLPSAEQHPLFYVGIYASIGLGSAFIVILSVLTQYTGALRASRILFKQLLVTVVHATMRWHDVTPAGRMLNRFSKDIETVDLSLASSLQAVNSSLANFFSSIIVVVVIFPFFVFPAFAIGYVYYRLALGYLNTGRDLRRMESTTRSPVFSGFAELLEGIVTVRAFSAERRFLENMFKKVDLTNQMWYDFWMMNRWLLLRFDFMGGLAVLTATLFALSGLVGAGWAGICITSAMAFTSNVYWACRFWTQLELDLNSVERVVEYLKLPQEPPGIIEDSRPPAHWPSNTGSNSNSLVVVEDLEVRYAPDLPAVLQGVSFELRARERVGLLGRTGSGKSTLAMSILRFVDPTKGKIIIDGIDIKTIGVQDLRSRLTFIPQDATLFSGTIRDNLDPFGEYSDEECIDALYRVQMMSESSYTSQRSSRVPSRAPSIHNVERDESLTTQDAIAPSSSKASSISSGSRTSTAGDRDGGNSPTKITLDTSVSTGGNNFSQGQRQLLAMARALLRQSSIIVLDEATSSIDFATDAKIQTTIREEFGSSLLLTVAHRLRTVIDYDRLIVLDQGKISEFDTPWNLIQKEGGIFRNMCLKSGTFSELEEVAKAKAEQNAA